MCGGNDTIGWARSVSQLNSASSLSQEISTDLNTFSNSVFIAASITLRLYTVPSTSITRKADGYYLSLSVEEQRVSADRRKTTGTRSVRSIPELELDTTPTKSNTIGIDVGLEKLYVDSNDNRANPQKHLRKSESKLAKLQRKLDDNARSKKAKKLVRRAQGYAPRASLDATASKACCARLHQKIARQRRHWHYNEAHRLCRASPSLREVGTQRAFG